MNWNVIQLDFEIWWVPLADENIMVEKGETWKVLSLTHVEYKVAHQMSILILVLFHHRRTILWGSCSQFTLFCLWSLSSSLPQLSLSGSCSFIYLALNLAIIKQCLSQPFVFNILTRRDLHTLTYAMGVIINYMGNYALKQVKFGVSLLNSILIFAVSGRTKVKVKREVQFEEFGMPSSHRYRTLLEQGAVSDQQFSASSCGLLAPTWLCSQCSVYITRWVKIVSTLKRTDWTPLVFMQPACLEVLWKLAWVSCEDFIGWTCFVQVAVCFAGAGLMAYSRVYLQYHTTSQVLLLAWIHFKCYNLVL